MRSRKGFGCKDLSKHDSVVTRSRVVFDQPGSQMDNGLNKNDSRP